MKADYFKELECKISAIFNMSTEDVLRGVVIKYLDYFYPVANGNPPNQLLDIKIEKAMDLVKSHLMYTVHEEVQILKERITMLVARINQLEMENSFLKANATPEVLTALNIKVSQVAASVKVPKTTSADGAAAPQ